MRPDNQWPIVRVTIGEDGMPARTALYTPGLPPGDHDLYCEPSEEMAEIRAAYEFVLPYLHVDIRAQALAIYEPKPSPLEVAIGEMGSVDQPGEKHG